jgi:hypothetical protein
VVSIDKEKVNRAIPWNGFGVSLDFLKPACVGLHGFVKDLPVVTSVSLPLGALGKEINGINFACI